MEKPTKVEVGQRWGYSDNPDDSFTVTNAPWAEHPDMACFTWNGGGEGAWETAEIPTKYKFLGYAPGYGPQQGAGPEAGVVARGMDEARERRDANGVAMSALEAIRSRKPPEPWVPSVDDWDLLPDV